MEKEVEEGNKSIKHEFILTNPDWLDLPESIATNIILEHLEMVDYIRFSAVCKKWYAIQKEHRILYSPHPPPLLLPFPWLRCNHCEERSILFYLPDKQKSYNIPFLRTCKKVHKIVYGHGCLLLLFDRDVFDPPVVHIFNPITGVQIKLPPCSLSRSTFCNAYISSPPTDPSCTVLIVNDDDEVYLYRLNNNNCGWRKVEAFYKMYTNTSAFCNNKFYRLNVLFSVRMIDTLLPDPVEQMIDMDYLEIFAAIWLFKWSAGLMDFFGELVMIVIVYNDNKDYGDYITSKRTIKWFHVYRADFSANKWVRMNTLGDGVLFYSSANIFALRAVDVGCKKNTIYSTEGFMSCRVAWRAFDLSTRDWSDGPPLSLSNGEYHSAGLFCFSPKSQEKYPDISWSWFLPSLDYFSGAKTNGACQNICLDT